MSDGWIWAAISLISSAIATALFLRWRLDQNARMLADHLTLDSVFHTTVVDRLARMETKIDQIYERQKRRRGEYNE